MSFSAEGKVQIPLSDFYEFVLKYLPKGPEYALGVPQVSETELEIIFAVSTECHPEDWRVPPKAVTQWAELVEKAPKTEFDVASDEDNF